MAVFFMANAAQVFRDYTNDGVPGSGPHQPVPAEIRDLLGQYEGLLSAVGGGALAYSSKATLDANLTPTAGAMAWVVGDATLSNNGIYAKTGGTGAGSWSRVADLPYSVIRLSIGGTANAITGTSSVPVPAADNAALVCFSPGVANTGAVTLNVNGAGALPLVDRSLSALPSGALQPGAAHLAAKVNGKWVLFLDVAFAAAAAAVAADRALAQAAAAAATATANPVVFASTAALAAANFSTAPDQVLVDGVAWRKVSGDPGHANKIQTASTHWYELDISAGVGWRDPATGYIRLGKLSSQGESYAGFPVDFNQQLYIAAGEATHFYHSYGAITITSGTAAGNFTGYYFHSDGDPATCGAGTTVESLVALRGNGTWGVGGTIASYSGCYAGARVQDIPGNGAANGIISYAYGGRFEAANETTGTGTITNAYGLYGEVRNQDGGVMATAAGVYAYVRNMAAGGGITQAYGLRIVAGRAGAGIGNIRAIDIAGDLIDTDWSIRSDGLAEMYHLGDVGIGAYAGSEKCRISSDEYTTLKVDNTAATLSSGRIARIQSASAQNGNFYLLTCETSGGSDTEFSVTGTGACYSDSGFTGTGADYAEWFEWADGNPKGEDRRGLTVVLDGRKVRPATTAKADVNAIIGVVSINPALVGDGDNRRWRGKYLTDVWATPVMEPYTLTEVERVEVVTIPDDEQAGRHVDVERATRVFLATESLPDTAEFERERVTYRRIEGAQIRDRDDDGAPLLRRALNPKYDPDREYIPREQRQEWATIGLLGKLLVLDGQPVPPRWLVMSYPAPGIIEYLVR